MRPPAKYAAESVSPARLFDGIANNETVMELPKKNVRPFCLRPVMLDSGTFGQRVFSQLAVRCLIAEMRRPIRGKAAVTKLRLFSAVAKGKPNAMTACEMASATKRAAAQAGASTRSATG